MRPTDQIIGESPAFLDLMDKISHSAPMNRPLLVIGERGSGKEMIAARLHFLSNRWNGPYQTLNCAALPETLLESELFGYEPGAFTGATKRRRGRFEVADGGTLFLDEIGTMSLAAQEKLLRVIEYGEFERVGGSETINVDVRVLGATNLDLPAAADRGEFRHDLLDRLAFDVLTVPPLRARREDILVLAEHFGQKMAQELEWLTFPGFTSDAQDTLLSYDWPGNVRELRNVVERAIYCAWDGEQPIESFILDPFDSPYRPTTVMASSKRAQPIIAAPAAASPNQPERKELPSGPFDLKAMIHAEEARLTRHALEGARYNQRVAASRSGLTYDQMRHLIKKHALDELS